MGHVSRCIPLIDMFIKNGNAVYIAADEHQQSIFRQYFPDVFYIDHEGYPFRFGERGNFGLDLVRQFRQLQSRLKDELLQTERFVEDQNIDFVVSDHRYGFLSSKAYSVMLTHQLNLPVKWYENWVQKIHHRLIGKFDEIWVPDTVNSDYAGELSRNKKDFRATYIGHLSRFSIYKKGPKGDHHAVIASGPDVYAVTFIREQLAVSSEKTRIIAGNNVIAQFGESPLFIPSIRWKEADSIILSASKIISRSGYSTLMDLVELKTPFSITPTPGQREQEYLFDLWYKKTLANTGTSV